MNVSTRLWLLGSTGFVGLVASVYELVTGGVDVVFCQGWMDGLRDSKRRVQYSWAMIPSLAFLSFPPFYLVTHIAVFKPQLPEFLLRTDVFQSINQTGRSFWQCKLDQETGKRSQGMLIAKSSCCYCSLDVNNIPTIIFIIHTHTHICNYTHTHTHTKRLMPNKFRGIAQY